MRTEHFLGWAILVFLLQGCSSTKPSTAWPSLGRELNRLLKDPYSDTQAVDVSYVTNRETASKEINGCSDQVFGVAPGNELRFGVCKVNAPKRHIIGAIEAAPNPSADLNRYFRALAHEMGAEDAFYKSIQPGDNVLVFVHGFNVRFEEALFRAAQLAYDLKFQGKVVLFAWPAGARSGIIDSTLINRTYEFNRQSAASTVPLAQAFFHKLGSTGARLQIIVHSMGHQVVLPALAAEGDASPQPFVQELILNAPDFGVEDFGKVLPSLKKAAERITLYCSPNDTAISASERYNSGKRLGACESFPGVDVINVSEIDSAALGGGLGHGYYASRPILTDVFQVMLGIDVERRLFVRKSDASKSESYFLRP